MADFDLFHVKISGIDDSGLILATVKVGFWHTDRNERSNIDIPVWLEADLDASLRELREQAKDGALALLRSATQLLEQSSTDELHLAAQEQCAKHEAAREAQMHESITKAFPPQ